jgi:hypothetical protein
VGNYGIDSLWYLLVEPATPTPTPTLTPTDTPTPTPTTQDRWYTGNSHHSAYGVKANIWAPTQEPYFEDVYQSGESNYVTLVKRNGYWVQTGWRFYEGWLSPKSYIESTNPDDGYYVDDISNHPWGTIKEYKIVWTSGTTTWCAWVDNVDEQCFDIQEAPPFQVHAHSEVHVSSQNGLDTRFSAVYYKDSSGVWLLFDQANWREDSPYSVQKDEYYFFLNTGP